MLGEANKQFSLTRAARSTKGRATGNSLSVSHRRLLELAFVRRFPAGNAAAIFRNLRGILAAGVIITAPTARASSPQMLFYSSADFGGSFGGGQGIQSSQWEGVRFQVNGTTTIDAIGGNIGVLQGNAWGNNLLFGALIQLTSVSDLPDSITLDTPDVLAYATFGGQNPSSDLVVPIGPVTVEPGVYGLVFGSGLFGATGTGFMTVGNPQTVSPSLFGDFGGRWLNAAPTTFRFTAYSIPEPGTGELLSLAVALARLRRSRKWASPERRQLAVGPHVLK